VTVPGSADGASAGPVSSSEDWADGAYAAELAERVARLSDELATVTAELQRSRERLSVFGAQVAHDLRNPLTSVSMSLQMLLEQPAVTADDETLWMVERALSGSERLNSLIEEQLQYAALAAELVLVEVDLGSLVREVASELGTAVEAHELPVVLADRSRLRVVLLQLLDNANRHPGENGPGTVSVSAERSEAGWRIEVADSGAGFSAEDRKQAFEPRPGEKPSGLVLCRRIMKAHGGRIGVETSASGGALVWLDLPS
jgi:signal transduction histidine kinase